jgi:acyl-CoA synthetase (AMP-forming)/AMP-acid ligase II
VTTQPDALQPGPAPDVAGLAALLDHRASPPTAGRVYLTDAPTGRQVTYGQLADAARGWWAELDRRAAGPGSRVALAVGDPLDFALAYLGIISGGRQVIPVAAGATGSELARALSWLEPDLVVADPALGAGDDVVTPDAHRGTPAGTAGPDGGTDRPAAVPGGTAGGALLASSGTTGTPKQVFLDTGRLLHVASAVACHHRLTAADVGYSPLPLVHVNAEVVGLLATLVAGSELVLDRRFHRQGFWNLVQARRVTWINAVPAILAILARAEPPTPAQTRSVRFVRSASAPLPLTVLATFEEATRLPVIETYGMTEAASQITANPLEGRRRPGSVGRAVGSEVRVVDQTGRACEPDETGHVQIRGAGVITAYATEHGNDRFRPGGWLETGDLGRLDADGFLYLAGRTDDVINRGGEKIFPREVEEVLLADPRVGRAVVYGLAHDVLGQVPAARVQLVSPVGAGASGELLADLSARCATALDRVKRPVRIEVVDDIPVGQTGKILRRLVGAGRPCR